MRLAVIVKQHIASPPGEGRVTCFVNCGKSEISYNKNKLDET